MTRPAQAGGQVVTVTLNPAVDVTYFLPDLAPGAVHRVREVQIRAGGKGVNVARVAARLGAKVTATGLAGGQAGGVVRQALAAAGVTDAFVPVDGETRRTVTVVEGSGRATTLNEPGPAVSAADWALFQQVFAEQIGRPCVVVLSGSLPPGLPADAYAALIRQASARGVAVILDTSGPALRAAIPAGPDVVKPNQAEAAEVTGCAEPGAAASRLLADGAASAVVTLGPAGLLAAAGSRRWRAWAPGGPAGNATGAGDACAAALAVARACGDDWPAGLRFATAVAAASVCEPVAGEVDPGRVQRLLAAIRVESACPG
jgi:tagatose 6-phosphate kinase